MNTQGLRPLVRLTFKNPASISYLGLVILTVGFVAVDTLFVHHEDASFAGVWLLFLAAPTIFVFFTGGDAFGAGVSETSWFLYIALTVSVLIQSFALGLFLRLLSGARPGRQRAWGH